MSRFLWHVRITLCSQIFLLQRIVLWNVWWPSLHLSKRCKAFMVYRKFGCMLLPRSTKECKFGISPSQTSLTLTKFILFWAKTEFILDRIASGSVESGNTTDSVLEPAVLCQSSLPVFGEPAMISFLPFCYFIIYFIFLCGTLYLLCRLDSHRSQIHQDLYYKCYGYIEKVFIKDKDTITNLSKSLLQ